MGCVIYPLIFVLVMEMLLIPLVRKLSHLWRLLWMMWLWFQSRNHTCVTLCRWPAKKTIPLSVLARNQTKGFGLEISPWPEVEGDARRELVGKRSSRAVGEGRRTRAVDTGYRSREASRQEIGSSDSERRSSQDVSAFQLLCGSFARIHTSVSLHMHKVLHNSPSALELTPSVLLCLFVCSLFLPLSRFYLM